MKIRGTSQASFKFYYIPRSKFSADHNIFKQSFSPKYYLPRWFYLIKRIDTHSRSNVSTLQSLHQGGSDFETRDLIYGQQDVICQQDADIIVENSCHHPHLGHWNLRYYARSPNKAVDPNDCWW